MSSRTNVAGARIPESTHIHAGRPPKLFSRHGGRTSIPFLLLVRKVAMLSWRSWAAASVEWAWRGQSARGRSVRCWRKSSVPGDLPTFHSPRAQSTASFHKKVAKWWASGWPRCRRRGSGGCRRPRGERGGERGGAGDDERGGMREDELYERCGRSFASADRHRQRSSRRSPTATPPPRAPHLVTRSARWVRGATRGCCTGPKVAIFDSLSDGGERVGDHAVDRA